MLDLSKYKKIIGGNWFALHTPGYKNPRGKGKIPGVSAGTYFYAGSEIKTNIPTGSKEYNPKTKEYDIDVMRVISKANYVDEQYEIFHEEYDQYRKETIASFDLMADAPKLLEELKEMRERLIYDGHTKFCFLEKKSCLCGKSSIIKQLRQINKDQK